MTTAAVLAALDAHGLPADMGGSFGPCSADACEVRDRFLDGCGERETGTDLCGSKGVHVEGPRAVLLVALALGLRVRPRYLAARGLTASDWTVCVPGWRVARPRPATRYSFCRSRGRGPRRCSARRVSRGRVLRPDRSQHGPITHYVG